ncbi:Cadherin-like and PC-esterase [Branchiostoma belcheri]|nr:Cadherin-like and PC-esterase [Branchiostoma belcheri]
MPSQNRQTPSGTPPIAGSPPGLICYVTDQINRIKPMPARLLNPGGASRGYIPTGTGVGLRREQVTVAVLQKLAGKIVYFGLAAVRLYCREMFEAIRQAQVSGNAWIPIRGPVRSQIEFWRFLDQWEGHVPWRKENHEVVTLSSDASGFKCAGSWTTEEWLVQFASSWQGQERAEIIAVKET